MTFLQNSYIIQEKETSKMACEPNCKLNDKENHPCQWLKSKRCGLKRKYWEILREAQKIAEILKEIGVSP